MHASAGTDPAATRTGSGRARAGRTATLLFTASDEPATSLMPALLTATLAASPVALGLVEGLASGADGLARLCGGALSAEPRRGGWVHTAPSTLRGGRTC